MHHGLLVATLEVPQSIVTDVSLLVGLLVTLELRLHQRLTEPRDVAMTEDPEAAGDQPLLDAVALGILVREKPHDGLGDRQADRMAHPRPPKGSRGSTFCEAHDVRTQA